MKQIMQNMSTGETLLVSSPRPLGKQGHVIINTHVSLISAGTERMLVDFGKASVLDKARQQPEKVKLVLDKVQTDGLMTTVDAVRSKLAQPLPLGYCNVGTVVEAGVEGFVPGDRVVSNGAHADMVRVPKHLCAKIPDLVSDEAASFTVIASIGLQGIRLVQPTLGEAVVVTGVGLIGLLTVQLLLAQGCRVLAVDFDESKLALAKSFGAEVCNPGKGEDPVAAGMAFSRGNGVDAVIVTASTQSSDPISQAANMCRMRGRIVLVGVTGLELNRADFYDKELSFQVSCSYGPGRYDANYEESGHDYPYGHVRWTEQRNFEAVLDMLASGRLDVEPLITHRFEFENAPAAYDVLTQDKAVLGVLLQYDSEPASRDINSVQLQPNFSPNAQQPVVGFIGAGNYASRVLIPAFKTAGAQLHTISTSSGVSGVVHGEKAGFAHAATDTAALINHPDINTVAIVTQHNSHAKFVCDALAAGKHVFVEKPLAINRDELAAVEQAYAANHSAIKPVACMVGFNRRFSPFVQKMKMLLDSVKMPKTFILTMNAGEIPADHWTQDKTIGGGRIIGEACHYIDLLRFLTGSAITGIQAHSVSGLPLNDDKASMTLTFADGSIGTIHYFANGHAGFPKERVEAFAGGRVLQLDNFRKLRGWGWSNFKRMSKVSQDKGQAACAQAFLTAIQQGKPAPIAVDELFEVARVTIDAAEQLALVR